MDTFHIPCSICSGRISNGHTYEYCYPRVFHYLFPGHTLRYVHI